SLLQFHAYHLVCRMFRAALPLTAAHLALRAAIAVAALLVLDVHHPVGRVLRAELRLTAARHAKARDLRATSV
ncbi:unnamed protein product, partial [Ectocarpus fasciculatus]